MPEIRLVAYDDDGIPIHSATLWRIGNPEVAKVIVSILAVKIRRTVVNTKEKVGNK